MQSYKTKMMKAAATLLAGASLCAALLPAGLASASGPTALKVEGSTTVQPIETASESPYEAMYPDSDLQVAGGGSGVGISKVLAGTIDIGSHSRPLKSSDGDIYKLDTYTVALDGICIVVANDSAMANVNNISKAQVKAIYEAESGITSLYWDTVDMLDGVNNGWPHQLVTPRARIVGSGTRSSIIDMIPVIESKELNTITATGLGRLDSNDAMAVAVGANDYAIGYVGLAYADSPVYGLKKLMVDGVTPTEASIRSFAYPLSRYLYMSLLKPEYDSSYNLRALDYINFILSPAGQNMVKAEGYFDVIATQPYWDVDGSHICNMGDVSKLGLPSAWYSTGTPGWIPEDVNNDGSVNMGDVAVLGTHWQWTW